MTEFQGDSPLSLQNLTRVVKEHLAKQGTMIPEGKTGALVAVVDIAHVQIAVATRIKDDWTVELKGTYPWGGDPKVEVTVKATW